MKNKLYSIALCAGLLCSLNSLQAQEKGKKDKGQPKHEKNEKKAHPHDHSDDEPGHTHDDAHGNHTHDDDGPHTHAAEKKGQGMDKDNQGKGHAYGKHKDGLEGREFGQYRASQAREQLNGFEKSYKARQEQVKNAEMRIERAKNRLAELENSKQLNDEAMAIYRFKITRAEKRLNDLKFLLVEKKDYTKRQRALLNEVYKD